MYEFLDQTVRQHMAKRVRSVAPELTLGDLLRLFAVEQAHAFPVENIGHLVGIVTKTDALKAFTPKQLGDAPSYTDVMGTIVDEIMSRDVTTVDADSKLPRVLRLMEKYHFEALPVVDGDGRMLGVITRDDVILALTRRSTPLLQALTTTHPPDAHYAIA